jgi:hypothetical protein
MKVSMNASRRAAVLCGAAVTIAASQAHAGMTDVSIFRTGVYDQTGATTVSPANGGANYYFAGNINVANNGDYDTNGANIGVPTSPGTEYTMTGPQGSSPFINYNYTTSLMTKSDLDTNFPTGDYVLTANNTSTGAFASATLTYDGTDFYPNTPTYTAATFNGLAGLNTANSYTFDFEPFVPQLTPDYAIFLTITDTTTGQTVYSDSSGVDTTTSFTVAGGTFTAGDSYIADLDFTNRQLITSPSCEGTDGQCPDTGEIGWDTRTDLSFTVGAGAVPEASTWVMMAAGFAGLGFLGLRGSRKTAAHAA